MRPEEARDLGRLVGAAIGGGAERILELHEGIAGRIFGSIGAAATPVRATHDLVARGAYTAVAKGLAGAARFGFGTLGALHGERDSIHDTRRGRLALGALNGAFGDLLAGQQNALTLPMTLRCGGAHVELSADGLARAYPQASPRIALLGHGLCQTDESWHIGAQRSRPYAHRLRDELGYTPLYLRYNSGRHISENGRELADLLDQVEASWPVEISEITLIGHAMGALVQRSACHYGAERPWVAKVRHVFALGAPHRGVPLEQVTSAASGALARLPETKMLATTLNLRSAGVTDLGHGYLVDEDWLHGNRDVGTEIPFLPGAEHCFISAAVARDPDSPAARALGDLLVLRHSAWAHERPGERMRFPIDNYRHIGGVNHFELLNHPAVYEQLKRWLGGRRMLEAGTAV
ncbi:MAG: esterase/lipase family protein [Solirubrobacteraceae bacterium]